MARQSNSVSVTNFVGGRVSDASPLNFPENAMADETNFVLNKDGSLSRRLGIDLDGTGGTAFSATDDTFSYSTFKWENVDGVNGKDYLVVQFANKLFFSSNVGDFASGYLGSTTLDGVTENAKFSFTSVDGLLVVVCGTKDVYIFETDGEGLGSVVYTTTSIEVRDFFGVEAYIIDTDNSKLDLRSPQNVTVRPPVDNQASQQINPFWDAWEFNGQDRHIYNLRNQGWTQTRLVDYENRVEPGVGDPSLNPMDPLVAFDSRASGTGYRDTRIIFPSNADSVAQVLYANTEVSSNRTVERFHPDDLRSNPIGSSATANGHVIIDLLDRSTSRRNFLEGISATYPNLSFSIYVDDVSDSIPVDKTSEGSTAVTQYAGRVWYAGFSGELEGGDRHSPRLSSYVCFSKLVESKADIGLCYQEGDPTAKDESDILDTDGGFIKIDGAYGIKALKTLGNSLFVLASNGVWRIDGGGDIGFTATSYRVTKVSENGTLSEKSSVAVDDSLFYWGDDGIYHIVRNQFGEYSVNNISKNVINRFYIDVSFEDKESVTGIYDSYNNRVRWQYGKSIDGTSDMKELIFDIELGAFYTSTIARSVDRHTILSPVEVPPYLLTESDDDVVVEGDLVEVLGDQVVIPRRGFTTSIQEIKYLTLKKDSDTSFTFYFSAYTREDFLDWYSVDSVGVDSAAFFETGWITGGDVMSRKEVPYATFHFTRTENGFEDVGGDIIPLNPSSCKVRFKWNFNDTSSGNRWSNEFQAYRYRRFYMPSGVTDGYDTGDSVVTTKNRLRGFGKSLSIRCETEPNKDCKVLGWGLKVNSTNM